MSRHDSYLATRHFASLDGFRAFSILAVILHHTWEAGLANLPMTTRGFLGVDMFFVLSGFLIVTLLLREQSRTGTIAMGAFYMRRALRIFPPYYFLLLALALAYTFVQTGTRLGGEFFRALPYNLTYTSNWIVMDGIIRIMWSLATEEQFYLLWPWVQKYFSRRGVYLLLGIVLGISQAMNFRLTEPWFTNTFGVGARELNILQVTFTPIALGALLANLLHSPQGFSVVYRCCGFPGASLVWLVLLLIVMNLPGEDISGVVRLTIQLTMTGLLAACVVREEHPLRGLLTLPPIRRMGVISYGMYLYHTIGEYVATMVVREFAIQQVWLKFTICLVLTVLLAELSYRTLEAWFLKQKGKWSSPVGGEPVTPKAG